MKRILSAGLVLAFAIVSQAATVTYTPGTGVLLYPDNFFVANSNLIVQAIAGAFPGSGSGNASTNVAQGWSASQTFNGPTFIGNTNLATAIGSKAPLASPALTGTPTVNGTNFMALLNGKIDSDPDLVAISALTGTGLLARTGAGTYAERTITGDAEITVSNGNGVSGNPVLAIGAGIARVASMAATYQPLHAVLTRLSGIGLGVSGDILIRDVAGWTNLAKGSDGQVLKLAGGLPSWGTDSTTGGAVATNQANAFDAPYTQTINGPLVANGPVNLNGTTTVATLNAGAVIYSGIWPVANGGGGGSTYTEIRSNLHVVPDLHVMAYYLSLLQINAALSGTGHVPRRISSGVITNMTVDDAALALLAATTAAGQRSAIGAAGLTGDTFTGPVLAPYMPYNANLTNTGSNYLMTGRAIAEKIEQITIGATFFTGVNATNFTNNAGVLDFAPDATLGTGKLLRESAAGSTPALSGMSDVVIPQPVGGPGVGDVLAWTSGGKWGNVANSKVSGDDNWVELFTELAGNGSAPSTDPFATANIGSGSVTISGSPYGGRSGVARFTSRLASVDQWTGENIGLAAGYLIPTNKMQWRVEFMLLTTNQTATFVGLYDDLTTNAPTDAVAMTVTNQVACFVAYAGGSKVVSATTFSLQTNTWYTALGTFTNGANASLKVYTNRSALAWSESLSSGLPYGEANNLGFGLRALSTGPASTNGTDLVMIDRLGVRWANPSN